MNTSRTAVQIFEIQTRLRHGGMVQMKLEMIFSPLA
jgi:hypothetical protein